MRRAIRMSVLAAAGVCVLAPGLRADDPADPDPALPTTPIWTYHHERCTNGLMCPGDTDTNGLAVNDSCSFCDRPLRNKHCNGTPHECTQVTYAGSSVGTNCGLWMTGGTVDINMRCTNATWTTGMVCRWVTCN